MSDIEQIVSSMIEKLRSMSPPRCKNPPHHGGAFEEVLKTFLRYNPELSEENVLKVFSDFRNHEDDYFRARFLSECYHLGLRYTDIKEFDGVECCRIDGGIPLLMESGLSFKESHDRLKDLSNNEVDLYAYLFDLGLTQKQIFESPFHKKYFLGNPNNRFINFVHYVSSWILPARLIDFLSWPTVSISQDHVWLLRELGRIKDKNNSTPAFPKLMGWVAGLNSKDFDILLSLVKDIKTKLHSADQREVIAEHEALIEDKRLGRDAWSDYLAPVEGSSLPLRIEGNNSRGCILSLKEMDYEKLTPIQAFVLAAGDRFGLTVDDLKEYTSEVDLLEFAAGIVGYCIERPAKEEQVMQKGMSYTEALKKMQNPKLSLHEKYTLGSLSSYGLNEDNITSKNRKISLVQAQALVGFYSKKTSAESKYYPNPEQALDEISQMNEQDLNLTAYGHYSRIV